MSVLHTNHGSAQPLAQTTFRKLVLGPGEHSEGMEGDWKVVMMDAMMGNCLLWVSADAPRKLYHLDVEVLLLFV